MWGEKIMFGTNSNLRIVTIKNPSAKELYPEEEFRKFLNNLAFMIDPDRFLTKSGKVEMKKQTLKDGSILTTDDVIIPKSEIRVISPWAYYREASKGWKLDFSGHLTDVREKIRLQYNEDLFGKLKAAGYPVVLPDSKYFMDAYQTALSQPDQKFRELMHKVTIELSDALEYAAERNLESKKALDASLGK